MGVIMEPSRLDPAQASSQQTSIDIQVKTIAVLVVIMGACWLVLGALFINQFRKPATGALIPETRIPVKRVLEENIVPEDLGIFRIFVD